LEARAREAAASFYRGELFFQEWAQLLTLTDQRCPYTTTYGTPFRPPPERTENKFNEGRDIK
jgi:hypothetical protein